MANKTTLDVCTRAARVLGYIAFDETLGDDEYAQAQEVYESLHEWMFDELKARWNKNSVEPKYFPLVAAILADWLMGDLKTSNETAIIVERNARKAEKRLRQLLAKKSRKTVQVSQV